MQSSVHSPGVKEKANLRNEITDQIREFLQRGGTIEVLEDKPEESESPVGTIWSDLDQDLALGD